PSDGNPQFRQQMVYAVAMRTIRNFERALGRVVHWPPLPRKNRSAERQVYARQLKMHPHFMQQPNAYYHPSRGFYFGYFQSGDESPFPGTTVFTCLSQDVIAHELTHAILHGMNISFEGSNPDVAAFHEAFADLVALLQHFWPSEVLRHQISDIRGQLDER